MPAGRPKVLRKSRMSAPPVKCCPTCLRVMSLRADGKHECEKHGVPTRR